MAAVANLYATLGLDAKGFNTGLNQAQTTMQKFTGSIARGMGFGVGLSAWTQVERAVGFVADGIGDVVTAASNMTETQTKLDQVFMSSADSMREWASGSAQSMIMSEQAALASAATFGNFLQALGQTEQASVEMSQQLVALSADLASYNNLAGGAEEATMRLFSGMSGEMEAVRRLGIDLSETAVSAYLTANGVKRVGMQFRQSDKTAARFALIMKDTAKAQGDVARTADNLANRQREFNAEIGNLQVALGESLVGPMADFMGFLSDIVNKINGSGGAANAITRLTDKINGLAVAGQDAEGFFGQRFLQGWGTTITDFGRAMDDIAMPDAARVREWTKALEPWATTTGATTEQLEKLARAAVNQGQTWEELLAQVRLAGRETAAMNLAANSEKFWGWAKPPEDLNAELEASASEIARALDDGIASIDWSRLDDGVDAAFQELRQSIKAGFGSVKDALSGKSDDRIIDPATRMENMRSRLARASANLRRAQQVNDPIGESYWRGAVNKQRLNMNDYEAMVNGTFRDIKDDSRRKARDTSDDVLKQARRMVREMGQLSLYDAGVHLVKTWASGIRDATQGMLEGGYGAGRTASGLRATSVLPAWQGSTVNINGNLYGGPAGLRELGREMNRLARLGSRDR